MLQSFFKYLLFCAGCDEIDFYVEPEKEQSNNTVYKNAKEFEQACKELITPKGFISNSDRFVRTTSHYDGNRMVRGEDEVISSAFRLYCWIPYRGQMEYGCISWEARNPEQLQVDYLSPDKTLEHYSSGSKRQYLPKASVEVAFDFIFANAKSIDEISEFIPKRFVMARKLKSGEFKVFHDNINPASLDNEKYIKNSFSKAQKEWIANGEAAILQVEGIGRDCYIVGDRVYDLQGGLQ